MLPNQTLGDSVISGSGETCALNQGWPFSSPGGRIAQTCAVTARALAAEPVDPARSHRRHTR